MTGKPEEKTDSGDDAVFINSDEEIRKRSQQPDTIGAKDAPVDADTAPTGAEGSDKPTKKAAAKKTS